jgi:hypothetical protein
LILSRAFFYIVLEHTKKIIMKKILYIGVIAFGTLTVISCASGEECVCDDGVTITEDDAKDSGATLSESCAVARIGGATCEIR